MGDTSFGRHVSEVDRRVRELVDDPEAIVRSAESSRSATWECGLRRASLVRHEDPARYQVQFLGAPGDPPEAEEIGVDDDDVVELVARPIADFLRG